MENRQKFLACTDECFLVLSPENDANTAGSHESFSNWKDSTLMTICNSLNDKQRSTFILELIGRLPSNDRLYLVSNLQKIAAVDFVKELPDELSVLVLSYLDSQSLFTALQVSRYWNKLLLSERSIWRDSCICCNISQLDYENAQPSLYYKNKLLSYVRTLHLLQRKDGRNCITIRSTSDVVSRENTLLNGGNLVENSGNHILNDYSHCNNSLATHSHSLATLSNSQATPSNSQATYSNSQATYSNSQATYSNSQATYSNILRSPAHVGRVLCVTANSTKIFSSGDDRFTRCWDRQTLRLLGEREGMVSSSLHCTDNLLVAGLYNGCILVYSCSGDAILNQVTTCTRHMGPVSDVMVAGEVIVSGSSDCSVRLWRVNDGVCLGVFRDHDTIVNKVLILENPLQSGVTRVFSLSLNCINVYSMADNTALKTLRPVSEDGRDCYFQAGLLCCNTVTRSNADAGYHGTRVLVCGSSHGIYMWDVTTYTLLRVLGSEVCLNVSDVVGVGSALIAAVLDDELALISTATGQHLATIPIPQYHHANCGIWLNTANKWLNGVFETGTEEPLFVVTTRAGEICSFYLNK